jgi:hypothetical protein
MTARKTLTNASLRVFQNEDSDPTLRADALDEINRVQASELLAFERQYQGSEYQKNRDLIDIDIRCGGRPLSVALKEGKDQGKISVRLDP